MKQIAFNYRCAESRGKAFSYLYPNAQQTLVTSKILPIWGERELVRSAPGCGLVYCLVNRFKKWQPPTLFGFC